MEENLSEKQGITMLRLSIALVVFMVLGGNVCAQVLAGASSSVAEKSSGDEKTVRQQTLEGLLPKYAPEDPNVEWRWHESEANIAAYLVQSPARYEVRLVRKDRKGDYDGLTVQVFDGDKLAHHWESDAAEAFVFSGTTLIYTEHRQTMPGCTLIAFDLKKQQEIWRKSLTGLSKIGGRSWSAYRNRVALSLQRKKVVVYGNELHGQYIEAVDLKTGETISNTVGDKNADDSIERNRF
jgi:hypothetical protein